MNRPRIIAVTFVLALLTAGMPAHPRAAEPVPDPEAEAEADTIREALLAPKRGWTMMWPDGQPFTASASVQFERRGNTLIARIQNDFWNRSCEREVSITAQAAALDLCIPDDLVLRRLDDDPGGRFRGVTRTGTWHVLQPKW